MSNRIRFKGKWRKKKAVESKIKALTAMAQAKKNKCVEGGIAEKEHLTSTLCDGRRIVEISELGDNLICCQCTEVLSLKDISQEKRLGLNSIFTVRCRKCFVYTKVATGKQHLDEKKNNANCKRSDTNSKAILGTLHAGIGCAALNKVLACLNIPNISESLYKRYERQVGPAIEEAARDSCRRAAEEERRLILENIDKLRQELPEEVSREIYANLIPLTTSPSLEDEESNSSLQSNHGVSPRQPLPRDSTSTSLETCRSIDSNIDVTSNVELFDTAVSNIINIVVSYDMGWSKRGNGRSYDSLNGYGAIIGFLSAKVLDFRTRNRKCMLCDQGRPKEDHACRLNFRGSAKAMEADVGAELVNESAILKAAGLNVRVMIGDEDSSTIAAVNRERSDKVFKLADTNHLRKDFTGELYNLRKQFKEMNGRDSIPHLKKCFDYAVFKNPELYTALCAIFTKYANKSAKFSVAASSQANESLNSIMAHKAPKNHCYSRSESADYRWASSVCTKNDGQRHLSEVLQKMPLSPGKHTNSFAIKSDEKKAKKSAVAKLRQEKARRNLLKRKREDLRKKMEHTEGVQYRPNCGLEVNFENIDINNMTEIHLTVDNCEIVYFDLESSSFGRHADILQLAARSENGIFSIYVNRTKPVAAKASEITGLENRNGELFFRGGKVNSIPLKQALEKFLEFLMSSPKPASLVAHNASFDTMLMLQAIKKSAMVEVFSPAIAGFADSLAILKKKFPDRKGKGQFTLSVLAQDFLEKECAQEFHEASYDVKVLKELVTKFIPKSDLIENSKSYKESLNTEIDAQNTSKLVEGLEPLRSCITAGIIKKTAGAGISYSILSDVYFRRAPEDL